MEFFTSYWQFWSVIVVFFGYTLTLFTMVDIILIYVIRRRMPSLKNKYFDIHRRYGFHKVNVLKAILAFFVVSTIHGPKTVGILPLILIYFVLVAKLLIDFIRETKAAR